MAHFMITYSQTGNPRHKMVCIESPNEDGAIIAFFKAFNPAHTQIVKGEQVSAEIADDFNRRQRRLAMSLARPVR